MSRFQSTSARRPDARKVSNGKRPPPMRPSSARSTPSFHTSPSNSTSASSASESFAARLRSIHRPTSASRNTNAPAAVATISPNAARTMWCAFMPP